MQELRRSFTRQRPTDSDNMWTQSGPPINISSDWHRFVLSCELRTGSAYSAVETLIYRNDWRKVLTTMVEVDREAALVAVSLNLNHLLEGMSEHEIAAVKEIFENHLDLANNIEG